MNLLLAVMIAWFPPHMEAAISSSWISLLADFGRGLALSFFLGFIAIKYLAPMGWIDHPGHRKRHMEPTPRTGGIALWFAIGTAQALGWMQLPIAQGEWICLHALALVGALDDRFNLRARIKAFICLLLAIALAFAVAQHFYVTRSEVVFLGAHIATATLSLSLPLLTIWFWVIPQALNLIDGMDGLLSGLALLITAGMLLGWGLVGTFVLLGIFSASFLLNWPKPYHFLGDCGAYFIGGLLGLLVFKTRGSEFPSLSLWIFGYPILDLIFVTLIRLMHGLPIFQGDRNHLHHHWERLIGSKWAVVILWVQASALSMGPTAFAGSHWVCWPTLMIMIFQCSVFAWIGRKNMTQTQTVQTNTTV